MDLIGQIFIALLIVALMLLWKRTKGKKKAHEKRVCVVVLGDIGRSPRMQYHSLSLAKHEFDVDLVGYGGSVPLRDILDCENIDIHQMREPPKILQRLPKIFLYITKVLWQCLSMSLTLARCDRPSYLLLQNPPAIPALAVVWIWSKFRGSKLIVDWHNYGYTILALAVGEDHILVRFSKWYEKFFGCLSWGNICVTNAMRTDLIENWGIKATTVYDRPPEMFRDVDCESQHNLFLKLSKEYAEFGVLSTDPENQITTFTEIVSHKITKRLNRPALLISSTSWTEDEDFSILLNALQIYENNINTGKPLPKLVCVITGKGPQKEYYKGLISQKSWKHVQICTPWVEAEDYPKLLGSADVGVCLHKSSSGLDLPMKVVDMFGCALPVCAIHFKCLDELVKHEENGLVFHSENELADHLQDLLCGFPNNCPKIKQFRENLKSFQQVRWDHIWQEKVLPFFHD